MAEWVKEYVIKMDGLKNVVLMEVLIDYESNRTEILDSMKIYEEEFQVYKDDSDSWVPMKKHLRDWAVIFKWSGIKYVRALLRIKQSLGMEQDDLAWVFDTGSN